MAFEDADTIASVSKSNTYKLDTGATVNSALIKAGARKVLGWAFSNVAAYAVYVKLYNKATAPTVGTDLPVITIPVAAGATITAPQVGGGFDAFPLGLGIGATKAVGDSDTTVTVAHDVRGFVVWN